MGELFDQLPDIIKNQIKEITKTSGLPDTEESLEKMSRGWIEKEKTFGEESRNMDMEEVELLENTDERGALAMTYSGSLVNIGPLVDGKRKATYVSIGLRKDVTEMVAKDNSVIIGNIKIGESIAFEVGPVKKTSAIYKIMVCAEKISPQEQEDKIEQVTTVIMDEFVEVNKIIIEE